MGSFTAGEISNFTNAALDFYLKGAPLSSTIQDKPLLSALRSGQKTFPGGKGSIKGNVKGDYTTSFLGYDTDDSVTYANPANIKQFSYDWKELHAGISVTYTELKKDGISVTDEDSAADINTSNHSGRDVTVISGILEDKLEDMDEGMARSFNLLGWQDGTSSSKVFPGILAGIPDDPTTGVFGGIDRGSNTWWRNRSLVGANKTTTSTTTQAGTIMLRKEVRQLRRYGGKPNLWLAGSGALALLEAEVQAKGYYSLTGFTNKSQVDIGMAAINMNGVGTIMYDPTLDDLGRTNFVYALDTRFITLYAMEDEDMKVHSPARPAEKYVLYRGVTWTGALVFRKMNCHGVYELA